jgi:putative transcriptional regulator
MAYNKDMNKKIFIKNLIKLARKKRKVTQKELADALGVSRQTVVSLEKNDYTPSLLLALKVSNYFHESIEEIFSIEQKQPTNNSSS